MGVWAVAVLDTGVTDETEAVYGASLYAYNFYAGTDDTDGGRTDSHGSRVAAAAELTNSSLERIDMQVASASGYFYSSSTASALTQLATMDTAGWSIGSYNMSFGSLSSTVSSTYQSQITELASRGIFGVAASGNYGSHGSLEDAAYPARLTNVISVGSHDGNGNPTDFSNNNASTVHVLADGEDFPASGNNGTSYASPQVAATVATVQALVKSTTDDRLTFNETVDVLQQGGAGPRSAVDPADGATTYFLHDHAGSVDYTLSTYVDTAFSGLEYIASYSDLEAAFGQDASAARTHLIYSGVYEGRSVGFDALEYVASYADLRAVFGTNREAAASHYLNAGRYEGRTVSFDPDAYMTANPDVAGAVGWDNDNATLHYLTSGAAEGRATSGGAPATSTPTTTVTTQPAVSEGSSDLPTNTSTSGYVGVGQSVTGTIGYWGDRDWFETDFTAGQTVVIQARGSASGGGTLYDPELYVRNSSGTLLAYNLDSGVGRDVYLLYTPTTTGTHYLDVDGYFYYTGSYTLEVTEAITSALAATAGGVADPSDRASDLDIGSAAALLAQASTASDPFGLL